MITSMINSFYGLLARPRLVLSIFIGMLVYLATPVEIVPINITRGIVAWNIGSVLYLVLAGKMMFFDSHERMRSRAVKHDQGSYFVLFVVIVSCLICLAGIVVELSVAKDLLGREKLEHIALVGLSVFTTWAFTQVMFALHYAHDFYAAEAKGFSGGLNFPGGHAPDYSDFLYFSCVIGTSGQTADVEISSRAQRRVCLVHCVLAFFFNTTLVALTINLASGLL
jgi:uncharacterized membrane protein